MPSFTNTLHRYFGVRAIDSQVREAALAGGGVFDLSDACAGIDSAPDFIGSLPSERKSRVDYTLTVAVGHDRQRRWEFCFRWNVVNQRLASS